MVMFEQARAGAWRNYNVFQFRTTTERKVCLLWRDAAAALDEYPIRQRPSLARVIVEQ